MFLLVFEFLLVWELLVDLHPFFLQLLNAQNSFFVSGHSISVYLALKTSVSHKLDLSLTCLKLNRNLLIKVLDILNF